MGLGAQKKAIYKLLETLKIVKKNFTCDTYDLLNL